MVKLQQVHMYKGFSHQNPMRSPCCSFCGICIPVEVSWNFHLSDIIVAFNPIYKLVVVNWCTCTGQVEIIFGHLDHWKNPNLGDWPFLPSWPWKKLPKAEICWFNHKYASTIKQHYPSNGYKTNDAIHWIVTYPGVSFIHYSNNLGQEFKFWIHLDLLCRYET